MLPVHLLAGQALDIALRAVLQPGMLTELGMPTLLPYVLGLIYTQLLRLIVASSWLSAVLT